MENLYRGQTNVHMMGAYCWTLHHEISETSYKRKSKYAASLATGKDSTRQLNKI
jgi:hypothetical protein